MAALSWSTGAAAAVSLLVAAVAALTERRRTAALSGSVPTRTLAVVDANRPTDEHGRVFHLQITAADVAPRILSVGDAGRAERIAALLDGGCATTRVVSTRGFVTHTGTYRGTPISVIATGMGIAMIDFVVRETRSLLEGPMAILRFGTCGGLRDTPAGTIVVASHGALLVRREPDLVAQRIAMEAGDATAKGVPPVAPLLATLSPSTSFPYYVSGVAMPDAALAEAVRARALY